MTTKQDYTIVINGHRVDIRPMDNYNFKVMIMDKDDTKVVSEYTHWNMIELHKHIDYIIGLCQNNVL